MKELEASVKERETLHTLVSSLYDVQHIRIILSNRFESRLHQHEYGGYVADLLKVENNIKRDMKARAKKKSITPWIVAQRGLGYDLASQLIAIIQGPEKFDNISGLWSYFGLAVVDWCTECNRPWYEPKKKAQKLETIARRLKDANDRKVVKEKKDFQAEARKNVCNCETPKLKTTTQKHHEGVLGDYNPEAKTLAFKIGTQFVKQGAYYRALYDKYRAEYEARDDLKAEVEKKKGKRSKGKDANGKTSEVQTKGTMHIHLMAQRRTVKDFLSDLWVVWRQLEGLPRTDPYIIAIVGHSKVRPPPPPEVRVKDGQPYLAPLPTESESEEVSSGSQGCGETQSISASHQELETQVQCASQPIPETQKVSASQNSCETQVHLASQWTVETRLLPASHSIDETQPIAPSQVAYETHDSFASQNLVETQIPSASHRKNETQPMSASHASIETRSQNASHTEPETHPRHASQCTTETQPLGASHVEPEPQSDCASQDDRETPCPDASHGKNETQPFFASHQADETQSSSASHTRIETHVSNASQGKREIRISPASPESAKENSEKVTPHDSLLDYSGGE